MGDFFTDTEDNPSDQLARFYDIFRSNVKSLMFAIVKSIDFVEDAQSSTISSFEHRDYFILEFTFSVDYAIVTSGDHKVILDTLEATVIFNIVDRKILKIEVEMDGIQWDEDEEVTDEEFNTIENEIRDSLKHAIQKQSLNPEILKQYQFSRTEYMAQMTAHILKAIGKSMKLLLSEGEDPFAMIKLPTEKKDNAEEAEENQ